MSKVLNYLYLTIYNFKISKNMYFSLFSLVFRKYFPMVVLQKYLVELFSVNTLCKFTLLEKQLRKLKINLFKVIIKFNFFSTSFPKTQINNMKLLNIDHLKYLICIYFSK